MAKGKGGNTVAAVWDIAEPIAKELGLDIWDIRFVKEGADWFLRIFIDKDGGVSIVDCENMSRAIDKPLDEADPIEQSYCLEVSSPGIERDLKNPMHYNACIGWDVEVKLFTAFEGRKSIKGILAGYDEENNTWEEIDNTLEEESDSFVTKKRKFKTKVLNFFIAIYFLREHLY